MAKLFPPILSSILPAFYENTIVIPFTNNRSVGAADINGYKIVLMNLQSTEELCTLTITRDENELIDTFYNSGVITYTIPKEHSGKLEPGRTYKLKMAYIPRQDQQELGYFSTTGIIKYTYKPELDLIIGGKNITGGIFSNIDIIGCSYKNKDTTERLYSSRLIIYENYTDIIYDSGDVLHTIANNEEPGEAVEYFNVGKVLRNENGYKVEYTVTTKNDLVYTKNFEPEILPNVSGGYLGTIEAKPYPEEGYIKVILAKGNSNSEYIPNATYEIIRQEYNKDEWEVIKTVTIGLYALKYDKYSIKDFCIESNKKYRYAIREKNVEKNLVSDYVPKDSDYVSCDFEYMFLFSQNRQLKIKYNEKVGSYKTDLQESKIETIGGKFPYIFRNGNINYKELNISGLLSYLSDENNLFLNLYEKNREKRRYGKWVWGTDEEENTLKWEEDKNPTTHSSIIAANNSNSLDNFALERKFKNEVLDWLNNGEPKLLKTKAEGNFIVSLMNVNLSPEDRLSRMLHSFSANAYEIAENNYDNLRKYNIIKAEDETEKKTAIRVLSSNYPFNDIKTTHFDWAEFTGFPGGTQIRININGKDKTYKIGQTGALKINLPFIVSNLNNFITFPSVQEEAGTANASELIRGTIKYQYQSLNYTVPSYFTKIKDVVSKDIIESYEVGKEGKEIIDSSYDFDTYKNYFKYIKIFNTKHRKYDENNRFKRDENVITVSYCDPGALRNSSKKSFKIEAGECLELTDVNFSYLEVPVGAYVICCYKKVNVVYDVNSDNETIVDDIKELENFEMSLKKDTNYLNRYHSDLDNNERLAYAIDYINKYNRYWK